MTDPNSEAATGATADPGRTRGRLILIALFVLFFGSAFGAGMLRLSGWMPEGLKNHGELMQPPTDLRGLTLALADGRPYDWNPTTRTWRILAVPPPACSADCARLLAELDKGLRQPAPGGPLTLTFEVIYGHALKPAPRHAVAGQTHIALDDMRASLRTRQQNSRRS